MRVREVQERKVDLPGYRGVVLNTWGKATLLLDLLNKQGLLPNCHIYGVGDTGEYEINGIPVGRTEEQVTTAIWLMVESYAAEGHIEYQNKAI